MNSPLPGKDLVPPQEKGGKTDTSHSTTLKTVEDAAELYKVAKNRLLDVSNWDKLCGPLTGTFFLRDDQGNKVNRLAKPGDYLKIDVPGPGSETGDGYDWVHIETIDEKQLENGKEEIAVKVRPAQNPLRKKAATAHFFKEDATSTFIISRHGNVVTAEVHGRNEQPNIKLAHAMDNVRNALMALSAILGFSTTQWRQLVKGLVSIQKLR